MVFSYEEGLVSNERAPIAQFTFIGVPYGENLAF